MRNGMERARGRRGEWDGVWNGREGRGKEEEETGRGKEGRGREGTTLVLLTSAEMKSWIKFCRGHSLILLLMLTTREY